MTGGAEIINMMNTLYQVKTYVTQYSDEILDKPYISEVEIHLAA